MLNEVNSTSAKTLLESRLSNEVGDFTSAAHEVHQNFAATNASNNCSNIDELIQVF